MFGFPLLLIPLAVCNIIVFLMRDVGFDVQLFQLPLPSGAFWKVALGDSLLALALLLLLLEVQKSARPGGKYVTDHLLSLLIFGGAAAQFVMLPQFANSTFFLLTLIAFVDFVSGLALRGRRPRRVREVAEPLAPVPAPVPASTPAPAAEPVLRREPIRDTIVVPERPLPEAAPVVVTAPAPSPTPLLTAEPAQTTARSDKAEEPLPPRVEPIIDLDPVLDEPRPPTRPVPPA